MVGEYRHRTVRLWRQGVSERGGYQAAGSFCSEMPVHLSAISYPVLLGRVGLRDRREGGPAFAAFPIVPEVEPRADYRLRVRKLRIKCRVRRTRTLNKNNGINDLFEQGVIFFRVQDLRYEGPPSTLAKRIRRTCRAPSTVSPPPRAGRIRSS